MKKIIIALLVLIIAGCSSKPDLETKKNELADLKSQLNKIQAKIAKLEKQIEREQEDNNTQTFKMPVKVKTLKNETFNHYIEVNGTIEAINIATISPETAGQIKNIYVKEGERVESGQILAKLNTITIDKGIAEVKTALDLASIVYEKQKNLWDQNIGSEIDYLTAKNNKESLEDKLESLKAQKELAYIKAPFGGIIDDIMQKEGELASPGVPMMQLINLNKLYINSDVAETYLPVLRKGEKVELSFPTYPKLNMKVPIHRVGNFIHPQNRTVNVQLQINNKNEMLKPNGLAVIRINDFSSDEALVVPSIIIKQDMKGYFLYVAQKVDKNWIAKKRYVKTGTSYKDQSMIVEGLSVNDKVIVEGYNQISDGTEITTI